MHNWFFGPFLLILPVYYVKPALTRSYRTGMQCKASVVNGHKYSSPRLIFM